MQFTRSFTAKTATAALALAALAPLAHAGSITYTPGASSFDIITAATPGTTDLKVNGINSDSLVDFVIEQKSVTLTQNLSVDITANGHYAYGNLPTGGTIAKGTVVNSYLLHTDPTSSEIDYTESITIPNDEIVVGVIVGSTLLTNSDFLGLANVTYATNDPARGLELTRNQDGILINGNAISLDTFDTHGNVDEARIITIAAPGAAVPEPASLSMLALAGGSLMLKRRRAAR